MSAHRSVLDPRPPRMADTRRIPADLAAMWAAAFALRAAYALLAVPFGAPPASDAVSYDTVAWNLASGRGFALDGAAGAYPTAFVPPLVPVWASIVYRIFGHSYGAARLTQCAIGAFLPLLLSSLGGHLFSRTVGRVAGWIAVGYPLLVFFNAYLLTETTFTVTLCLALVATAAWLKTPRGARALWTGAAWGLATLTRPTAALLPLLLLGWAWRPLGLSLPSRDRVRQVALVLAGLLALVGPWTLRNAVALRAFVPVTTGGWKSLLDSNNEVVLGDPRYRGNAVDAREHPPYDSLLVGLGEVEADRRSARLAREFLLEHRADWPRLAAWKVGRMWRLTVGRGTTGTWQAEGSPFGALLRRLDPLALSFGLALPFALWGAVRALSGPRRWFQSLPLWVIAYFTALAAAYWGSLRGRLPAEPMVVVLAALGAWEAWRLLPFSRRRGRILPLRREQG